jgi:Flp pilus assembly protein TadD
VPQSKSPSVITVTFRPPAVRWLLLLPALVALLGACLAVRWYVGNTIAEFYPATDEGGIEMARMAVRWSPGDPLTHWRLASFEEKTFTAESLARAVREYELAVMAAPYDYRYWMELGRALEAAGNPDAGEKALRRAVELAPAYSYPRWYYGNLLVRQGKTDEAFGQLARAAEADEGMQPQIFALTSQVFGSDLEKIAQTFPSSQVRMRFAVNLVNSGKFDDALRVLRTVSPADRKAQSNLNAQAVTTLIAKGQFHAALVLMRELDPGAQLPAGEQFWNGSFEDPIPFPDPKPFRWVINNRSQAQITIDSRGHAGKGSLRIIFKAPSKLVSILVSQTIIVEPNTQYRVQYYQRSEGLTSASTPSINVTDPGDGASLTFSPPMPSGTNDWQLVTLDFKTKPKTEAIAIGINRSGCDDQQPICPIFGTVWYDDFNLQRLGSSGSGGKSAGRNSR